MVTVAVAVVFKLFYCGKNGGEVFTTLKKLCLYEFSRKINLKTPLMR